VLLLDSQKSSVLSDFNLNFSELLAVLVNHVLRSVEHADGLLVAVHLRLVIVRHRVNLLSDSIHESGHDLVELLLLVDDFSSVDSSCGLSLLRFFLAFIGTRSIDLGIKVSDVVLDDSNGGVDLSDAEFGHS
jgi:hypothetical protein